MKEYSQAMMCLPQEFVLQSFPMKRDCGYHFNGLPCKSWPQYFWSGESLKLIQNVVLTLNIKEKMFYKIHLNT